MTSRAQAWWTGLAFALLGCGGFAYLFNGELIIKVLIAVSSACFVLVGVFLSGAAVIDFVEEARKRP